MKIVSSLKQELFNLVLQNVLVIIAYIIFTLLFTTIFSVNSKIGEWNIAILAAAPIVFWVWYRILGKGIGEKGAALIEFDKEGFKFLHYETESHFKWKEIERYQIIGKIFKRVKIFPISGKALVFDYYLFSPYQRNTIFRLFDENL